MAQSVALRDAIEEFRGWDNSTRPILHRLTTTVQQINTKNRGKMVRDLTQLQNEVIAASNAVVAQMDDRFRLLRIFENELTEKDKRIAELEQLSVGYAKTGGRLARAFAFAGIAPSLVVVICWALGWI